MVEDLVPCANCGSRSSIPNIGGGRSSHGSKDYDDIPNDDGVGNGNVRNGNDDKIDRTLQNGNDEDVPANIDTIDEVEGLLQVQDINNGTSDGIEGAL